MQISVSHTTRFAAVPVHGLQRLRLKPESANGQTVLDWTMTAEGAEIQVQYDDHHGNHTALVSLAPDTGDVVVHCTGLVETSDRSGLIGPHTGAMPLWAFLAQTDATRPGPGVRALAARFHDPARHPRDRLRALAGAIAETVRYRPGDADAGLGAEAALAAGQGGCRDHAQVFIAAARLLDIPARYVSGYRLGDEPSARQAGHGWAEAHIGELGWVGFDIAHGGSPDERHVRVATGLDYHDAAPVTGVTPGGGASVLLSIDRQGGGQRQFQSQ